MTNISYFLLCTFLNFLAPGLLDAMKINVMKEIN